MSNDFVFEVEVETTNSMRNSYCIGSVRYFDCIEGKVYVLAENIGQVHALLGDVVRSCKRLGIGRCATHTTKAGGPNG